MENHSPIFCWLLTEADLLSIYITVYMLMSLRTKAGHRVYTDEASGQLFSYDPTTGVSTWVGTTTALMT